MKRLLILLIILINHAAGARPLPSSIVRPLLVEDEVYATVYRVEPITQFRGRFVEGYIYQDIKRSPNLKVSIEEQVIPLLEAFDKIIYPFLTKNMAPDKNAGSRNNKKIILLFDRITGNKIYRSFPKGHYKGYYSQLLTRKYNREIITIDCQQKSLAAATLILLHELTHLIRDQYGPQETRWLHEGLAKFAEFLFVNRISKKQLDKWQKVGRQHLFSSFLHLDPVEYFQVFFFIYYLYQHFGGIDLIRNLMVSSHSGVDSIQRELSFFKQFETDPYKAKFYSFKAAFINYHVALWAHPHRYMFDTSGMWDLKLDEGVLSHGLKRIPIQSKHTITLRPGESIYFALGKNLCVEMDSPAGVYSFVVDYINSDDSAIVQLRNKKQFQFYYSGIHSQNSLFLFNSSVDQTIQKIRLKICD